jgi:hypothetical protein
MCVEYYSKFVPTTYACICIPSEASRGNRRKIKLDYFVYMYRILVGLAYRNTRLLPVYFLRELGVMVYKRHERFVACGL